jgi:hypothetical protein
MMRTNILVGVAALLPLVVPASGFGSVDDIRYLRGKRHVTQNVQKGGEDHVQEEL